MIRAGVCVERRDPKVVRLPSMAHNEKGDSRRDHDSDQREDLRATTTPIFPHTWGVPIYQAYIGPDDLPDCNRGVRLRHR
jgi:hypothetical protein